MAFGVLRGPRHEIGFGDPDYPVVLRDIPKPPEKLFAIGNIDALRPGLAVVGARRATPYGKTCARRFSRLAAEKGVNIISGGARGCDSEAHRAALDAGGQTVVFLGGGCDEVYPPEHAGLFQQVIDAGGAVVSEHPWHFVPLPYTFRERNRLIAGLSMAVLIVEAGLPSGTFSTADEALDAGREVFVVPGSITSPSSHGSNRLLLQGAVPVVDDESFEDALFRISGALVRPMSNDGEQTDDEQEILKSPIVQAAIATPMTTEGLYRVAAQAYGNARAARIVSEHIAQAEALGFVARQADGRWGPRVKE